MLKPRVRRALLLGGIIVSLGSAGLFNSSSGALGSYEIKEGGRYRVCSAYLENLRAQSGFPDANGWPIDTALKLLQKPKWAPLDPAANFEQVMNLFERAWAGRRQPSEAETKAWRASVGDAYRIAIEEGKLSLDETDWDIDNNGRKNSLMRITYRDPERHVYDTQIDIAEASDELFKLFAPNGAGSPLVRDVFSYDGRKFVIGGSSMFISIHEIGPGMTDMVFIPICTFRYRES